MDSGFISPSPHQESFRSWRTPSPYGNDFGTWKPIKSPRTYIGKIFADAEEELRRTSVRDRCSPMEKDLVHEWQHGNQPIAIDSKSHVKVVFVCYCIIYYLHMHMDFLFLLS